MNELTSKTISFLRFPLCVMVVLMHTQLSDAIMNGVNLVEAGKYPVFEFIEHLLSSNISKVRVPLFFFISGYLFFSRADFKTINYPPIKYFLSKYKSRLHTLLIPYIFWNLVHFGIIVISQIYFPDMMRGNDKLLADYGVSDWFNIFWDYKGGEPANLPLWFLRDLIVISLCSPLIFLYIKKLKLIGIILLGVLWATNTWFSYCIGYSIMGVFYFSFGAYFRINDIDFLKVLMPYKKIFVLAFLIFVIAEITIWKMGCEAIIDRKLIYNTSIFCGVISVLVWSAHWIEKGVFHENAFLASTTFFIYAYHGKPIAMLNRLAVKILQPCLSNFSLIVSYFLIPTVIVLIGMGLYVFLKKHWPRFANTITGGR